MITPLNLMWCTYLKIPQPTWVPPNVRFDIDDCTKPWTWPDNTFDFVHIRFMTGAIKDWAALVREAYRCCKPGGWIESGEFDPRFFCDDGTADNEDAMRMWNSVFEEGGKVIGNSFTVIEENIQDTEIRAAGFENVEAKNFKVSVQSY